MGLILVIVFAVTVLFVLIGKFLLKDLGIYFWNMIKGQFRQFNKQGNNLGQLFSTIIVAVFIGGLSFLFYKTILILAAYLLSGNLVQFFVVNRGVFSSSGTELQNPYLIKNMLYGVIITPLAQLFSIYFMIKSLRYFMLTVNNYFNQKMYKVSSLVFFGTFACLIFLVLELLIYTQSITTVSTLSLILLLIGAKLSYLLYYFGIIHIELYENKSYSDALKDFRFNKLEAKLITNPIWMISVVLIIAIVLNFPLYTGFQFGSNNWIILLKSIMAGGVFFYILKKVFAKGFNYIGVYMLDDNKNQDILPIKFINKKSKKIIFYGIVTLSTILIFISFKSFFFFLFNTLVFAFIAAVILFTFFAIGTLYSKFRKNTDFGMKLNWLIVFKAFTSFMILLIPAMLFMVLVFSLLTAFPKENKDIANYTDYQKSIIDEQGNLLYFNRNNDNPSLPINYKRLPSFFVKALLIKEDRNVLNQNDLFPNLSNWHGVSLTTLYSGLFLGSSNLNSQLIKNLVFDRFPQEMQRKISEIGTSYQLSVKHTPEEIITHYSNVVSFNGGTGHSGILKGAYHTFGRSITNINELEQMYLLFTLHRGSDFKIYKQKHLINSEKEKLLKKKKEVLEIYKEENNQDFQERDGKYKVIKLKEEYTFIKYNYAHLSPKSIKNQLMIYAEMWFNEGVINKKEFKKLKRQKLNFINKTFKLYNLASTNTFLSNSIINEPNENVTFESSITAENQFKMKLAVEKFETEFSNQLMKDGNRLYASAIVVDVKTGNILSQYGGEGVSDMSRFGKGNPIGSLIKPFVLLELLEQGHQIRLYDGKIKGKRLLHNYNRICSNSYLDAIGILKPSKNSPMGHIFEVTPPIPLFISVEEKFSLMGIPTDSAIDLYDKDKKQEHTLNYPIGSLRLTVINIAQSYQTLFNEGNFKKLSVINKSFNPYELTETVYKKEAASIYNKQNVKVITDALKTVLDEGGTAHRLKKFLPQNIQFMAKTGTTDKYRHGYTVLCDGKTLVVSWVSYGREIDGALKFNQTEIPNKSGGASAGILAAFIFNELYR